MKITEDVRKYAAEHGLTDAEAIESGMQEKKEGIPREGRESLREWVAHASRVLVPVTDIRRGFKRSLTHLIDDYLPLATRWAIWDNRGLPAKRLATSATDGINSVRDSIGI